MLNFLRIYQKQTQVPSHIGELLPLFRESNIYSKMFWKVKKKWVRSKRYKNEHIENLKKAPILFWAEDGQTPTNKRPGPKFKFKKKFIWRKKKIPKIINRIPDPIITMFCEKPHILKRFSEKTEESLTILNVFKPLDKFYSQINLNYKNPVHYLTKKKYLLKEDKNILTLIFCMSKINNSVNKLYIFNKLNHINYKLICNYILKNQIKLNLMISPFIKIICIFKKPNFFYTIYQKKKIKKIKKSRKKQLYLLLANLQQRL